MLILNISVLRAAERPRRNNIDCVELLSGGGSVEKFGLCCLLAAFALASIALPASGATWHVYADGSGDAPTIKAAVASAAAGDSIVVFPGTYNEHDILVTKQLFIVSVAGELSTIIDAQSLGRCFEFTKFTAPIAIKGFTLRFGTGQFDPVYTGFGGAILCRSRAHVDFTDCAFRSNSSNLGGAVLARDSSAVRFRRCSFFDNLAYQDNFPGEGGAIKLLGPTSHLLTAEIDSCLFVNNTAQSDGGALCFSYCTPWIRDCTFNENHASAGGGTITLISSAGIVLAHTIVSFNAGYGVVAWSAPSASLFQCNDVYGNSSGNYGGMISDQTGINDNISADPWFCNAPGNLSISTTSPCAPLNSPCHLLIGRYGPFCGPDLTITGVSWWWTTTQPAGTTTYATFDMQNAGDKAAGQFFVDFYKNRQYAPPYGGGLRGDSFGVIPGLAAGAPYAFQTASMTSDTCAEWQSWFMVDTDNQVGETNETNNVTSTVIVWQPPDQPGWPVSTGSGFHSSPVIAPLDDDFSTLEVAIGCDNGKLYAWTAGGAALPGFPVTLPDSIVSSPAVGDVTGDYRNEIVVGCNDGGLYVYDCHGAPLWFYATGSAVRTTPSLADLDDDGKLEIICASSTKIHVLTGAGLPLNKGWPYEEDVFFAGAAVGDVDGDGGIEIAAAARIGDAISKVYLFEADGTQAVGAWPVQLDARISAGPALGDLLSSSSGLEIVAGDNAGYVHVITAAGVPWGTVPQVLGSISSSPIIEDIDIDGHLEIVVASKILGLFGSPPLLRWEGYVTAIDHTGAIASGWPTGAGYWAASVAERLPSPVALGTQAEAMAGSPANSLYSWYGSGARAASFPIDLGADILTSAAAGQIDGDNWVELVVATSAGNVYCRELRSSRYPKTALWWPMYGHDRLRTHCYGFDVPTGDDNPPAAPAVTALGPIYPNPFNPTTKITFDMCAKGRAEIAIYDVSGRKLAVLVDRELEAGRHETLWNGKTAGGRTVASGIYFCTLRAAGVSETKKIVLLR